MVDQLNGKWIVAKGAVAKAVNDLNSLVGRENQPSLEAVRRKITLLENEWGNLMQDYGNLISKGYGKLTDAEITAKSNERDALYDSKEEALEKAIDLANAIEFPTPLVASAEETIDDLRNKIKTEIARLDVRAASYKSQVDDVNIVHGIASLDSLLKEADELRKRADEYLVPLYQQLVTLVPGERNNQDQALKAIESLIEEVRSKVSVKKECIWRHCCCSKQFL